MEKLLILKLSIEEEHLKVYLDGLVEFIIKICQLSRNVIWKLNYQVESIYEEPSTFISHLFCGSLVSIM